MGMSEGLRASARCRQRALARRRLLERSEKVEEGRPVRPEYGSKDSMLFLTSMIVNMDI